MSIPMKFCFFLNESMNQSFRMELALIFDVLYTQTHTHTQTMSCSREEFDDIVTSPEICTLDLATVTYFKCQNAFFVICRDGRVFSRGTNFLGTLGYETQGYGMTKKFRLIEELAGCHVTKVVCVTRSTFFLTKEGDILHGGGRCTLDQPCVQSLTCNGFVDIASGIRRTIALHESGSIFITSGPDKHDIEKTVYELRAIPQFVILTTIPEPIRAIYCGYEHFVAVGTQGDLWGWGRNDKNQLGFLGPQPFEMTTLFVDTPTKTDRFQDEWDIRCAGFGTIMTNRRNGCSLRFGDDEYDRPQYFFSHFFVDENGI